MSLETRPKLPLIDEWSIREKLALASSVNKTGDQNWYSVTRLVKNHAEPNRPNDWFSQKNCALQYEHLLEKADGPRTGRSKRVERGEETTQDVIVRELQQKRIEELKNLVKKTISKLCELKKEHEIANGPNPPQDFIKKVLQAKKDEEAKIEEDKVKLEESLKAREVKKMEIQAARRQGLSRSKSLQTPSAIHESSSSDAHEHTETSNISTRDDSCMSIDSDQPASTDANSAQASSAPSTSPLLTSLLQNASGTITYSRDASSPTKTSPLFSNTNTLTPTSAVQPSSNEQNASNSTNLTSSETTANVPSATSNNDKQLPTSSPTLTKLLELPVSNSGNKLPPLPVVDSESTSHTSTNSEGFTNNKDSTDTAADKASISIKEEPMDISDSNLSTDKQSKDPNVSQSESKTPGGRQLRGRGGAKVATRDTPTGTMSTRRSGRIKLRESESEPSTIEKKPSLSDDPTDASASEESLDALVKAQASSSKAPSISDSVPNSPASSTVHSDETELRISDRKWKQNIVTILRQAQTHQQAHWFAAPVKEKEAEGYHDAVKRPMDLTTIKRKIDNPSENGIRNTVEFQRDMMLMFENAYMFNKKGHPVHEAALMMEKEILDAIDELLLQEKGSLNQSSIAPSTTTPAPSTSTSVAITLATIPNTTVTTSTASVTNAPSVSGKSSNTSNTEHITPKPRATRGEKKQPASATNSSTTGNSNASNSDVATETGATRRRSRASTDEPSTSSSTPVTRTMKKKTTN